MTDQGADQNEPFVSAADRPQVGLHPDTPVSEMKVRDLQQLLGGTGVTLKPIIHDTKGFKHEKWEHPKFEKFEKYEHLKWEKHEKVEFDLVPKRVFETGPDPTHGGGDPIGPLISQISALQAHVQQLGQQIEELKKSR